MEIEVVFNALGPHVITQQGKIHNERPLEEIEVTIEDKSLMEMEKKSQENRIIIIKEVFQEKRAVHWLSCPLVGIDKKVTLVSHDMNATVVPDKKKVSSLREKKGEECQSVPVDFLRWKFRGNVVIHKDTGKRGQGVEVILGNVVKILKMGLWTMFKCSCQVVVRDEGLLVGVAVRFSLSQINSVAIVNHLTPLHTHTHTKNPSKFHIYRFNNSS